MNLSKIYKRKIYCDYVNDTTHTQKKVQMLQDNKLKGSCQTKGGYHFISRCIAQKPVRFE